LVLVVLSVCFAFAIAEDHKGLFLEWTRTYGKSYSAEESEARFQIFKDNLNYIQKHNEDYNRGLSTFTLAMNRFGDLTNEEFKRTMLTVKSRKPGKISYPEDAELPVTWDWTKRGGVTPVPNQEQCGSCWCFAALGAVETCHFIQTGTLVALSAQQLMDCSGNFGNQGCNGGLMDSAFQYIIANKGIDTEACYPYVAQQNDNCTYKASCCGSTVTSFVDLPPGNETALQYATYKNSIAVGIDAGEYSFQFYSTGVYYEPKCNANELDHSPLVVGWGVAKGLEYWNVRNSWGTDWGMKGYIWMSRNKDNNCGIASEASYPLGCYNC